MWPRLYLNQLFSAYLQSIAHQYPAAYDVTFLLVLAVIISLGFQLVTVLSFFGFNFT